MNAQHKRILIFFRLWLPILSVVFGVTVLPAGAGARNPCAEPGNLTYNCGFDVFVDRDWQGKRLQVPDGWWYFILNGDMDFRPSDDTYWGAPSLWLLSDGVPFTAGVYQQVQVTPGVVYQSDIGWAAPTKPDFERKIGLDPTGGTDPLASTVVWGPSAWAIEPWPDLTVSARATGPTMTVFVWVAHPHSHGNDWVFLDAVGLWPDTTQPAATVTPKPTLTPTPRPPTRTPSPAPPTDAPTALPPTSTPTETPPPPPTETPTPTPTLTPTLTFSPTPVPPTDTPAPTWTPTMTPRPVAQAVNTPAPRPSTEPTKARKFQVTAETVLLFVAGGAVVVSLLLMGFVVWLWLRSQSAGNGDE